MKVAVGINTPEVSGPTAAHLVLTDPVSDLPVVEIAIRGAGYVVLTGTERLAIANEIMNSIVSEGQGPIMFIPDREEGYHSDTPPLWMQVAAEQAAKREASRGGRVTKVGGKKIRVPESLDDIAYPEGCEFLEPDADGNRLVKVPSRKGETAEMKRFRRACKRARAQQFAFLAAQKDPSIVEEGVEDDEGGEE